ncbi:MAG: hypothetical protein IPO81_11530 [Kouleothrix sp.]|nr:hypothetical protein [Kouleothrix sp.]
MKRRAFLSLAGGLALGAALPLSLPRRGAFAATADRLSKWQPNTSHGPFLAIEWRYIAGKVADPAGDYGFIVAISDIKYPSASKELLVEWQDLSGSQAPKIGSYSGTLAYNSAGGTYTFQDAPHQASVTWRWDNTNQVYNLSVASPELTLTNLVLRPQGPLILEGGDGTLDLGDALGFPVGSDYYADWTTIEIGGQARGVARVDMQGLYPAATPVAPLLAQPDPDYDHHWFAVAGQLGTTPVWISAWRIEAQPAPFWDVTIAVSGASSAAWQSVLSKTEADALVEPLSVRVLDWQPLPASAGPLLSQLRTGQAWRITAGVAAPGDLIDLTIAVPPGQFAAGARLGATGVLPWMEEAVGAVASGTVQGQALSGVRLVVAETTAEFNQVNVPLVLR